MKITFQQTFSTERQLFRGGKEYDVTDAQGAEFVASGIANRTDGSTPPPAEPEPIAAGADLTRNDGDTATAVTEPPKPKRKGRARKGDA
ncbi:MAG TPA: hypothetical protein VGN72_07790 [Tepidisphaeraceae bacterium]|jgi:hypothetical protein|nr:hypothetical protein [Tepidisphaeraceae bacterium]